MYIFLILLILCLPIFGMAAMEAGAWGPDIGSFGYPNGATQAYVGHVMVLLLGFLLFRRIGTRVTKQHISLSSSKINSPTLDPHKGFLKVAKFSLFFQIAFFAITLALGGYKVLFLEMGKSELRSSVGPFGFLIRSYAGPMLFAFTTAHYMLQGDRQNRKWLLANALFLILSIMSWGYRAGFVFALIPAILIMRVNLSSWRFVGIGIAALLFMVASQLLFERDAGADSAFYQIFYRATVGTANSAWKVWDMVNNHHLFPAVSFKRFFGDTFASLMGWYQRADSSWYNHDFTAMMTAAVKGNPSDIDAVASNVTASSFSAGLIIFGTPGYLIYSFLNGLLVALVWFKLRKSSFYKRPVAQAFWATFFASSLLPFLDSGDPLALGTMPNFMYYGASLALCLWIHHMSDGTPRPRRA